MERLERELKAELGRLPGAAAMTELVGVWPEAVGELVARNAWPARLARDGTLHVAASSSTWAFELAQLAPTILARLGETAGTAAPKAVRFAPGPVPEPAASARLDASPSPRAPSPEERDLAAKLTSGITDEVLRALVARAAAASLARAAGDRAI